MQAVRFHGIRDIRLETVPIPKCGKGQVKIKPAYVGICGSDLHEYLDGATVAPTTPHPITGEQVPVTLGHEFSGVIEEVGPDISDIAPGTRVCVQPTIFDGTCSSCVRGSVNNCYSGGFIGLSGWGGGLSDAVVVPRHSVFKLPDNVPLDIGALVEPLAVAWHAVNVSPFQASDSVLVMGGGPIGLAVIQALKARGAKKVIVSEISSQRKRFAQEFGAHYVLDPSKEDVVTRVKELCGGQGADLAFDAAGVQASLDQALKAIRANGMLINIALWGRGATIRPDELVFGERTYRGSLTYVEGDFAEVINALSTGVLKPENMITRKIQMDEVEEKGLKALIDDKDNHVKILIEVHPAA